MNKSDLIKENFTSHNSVIQALNELIPEIEKFYQELSASLQAGGTIFICGNGGSAADAQHVVTELVIRYRRNRKAIPAIALTTDTSILTAGGNDIGFENIFARQVEALMKPNDILVAISTSGKSPNIIRAVETAAEKGCRTIAFTGSPGEPLAERADFAFRVPAGVTARIQEAQILIWHILCDLLEHDLE